MKKMRILAIILVCVLALTACGSKNEPEESTVPATTAAAPAAETAAPAEPLTLTDWEMGVTTWSSPNGATVHVTATPNYYAEGQTADFVVRLESDDVSVTPCQWDGTNYTASTDLNAANGYCYYMILTAADGTATEVSVNTPAAPYDEALINMEASLTSYCTVTVEESSISDSKLTLTACKVQVQAPIITSEGEAISCQEASLILDCNGQLLTVPVTGLNATETAGLYEADCSGTSFDLPEMEADQNIALSVNVTLTNGQNLTSYGSSWVYSEGNPLPVVG